MADTSRQIAKSDILTASVRDVYGLSADRLKLWRKQLGHVKAGSNIAKILCIGNSKTAGVGPNLRTKSWPAFLAAAAAARGLPSTPEAFFGNANTGGNPDLSGATLANYTAYDGRLTWPGGAGTWALYTANPSLGGAVYFCSDAAGYMRFTPGKAFDQVDIYYIRNTTNGSFTAAKSGGATQTVATIGSEALIKATLTFAGAASAGYVDLTWLSGGQVYIVACVARDSATPSIEVYNAGWGGSISTQWAGAARAWSPVNAIGIVAPALTLISLDTNDYTPSYGPVPLATYQSNLQAIITAAKATGDVVVSSDMPSQISRQTLAIQQQYWAAAKDLAEQNGVGYFDLPSRTGGSYEVAPSNWYIDTTHGAAIAYADQGYWYADSLLAA